MKCMSTYVHTGTFRYLHTCTHPCTHPESASWQSSSMSLMHAQTCMHTHARAHRYDGVHPDDLEKWQEENANVQNDQHHPLHTKSQGYTRAPMHAHARTHARTHAQTHIFMRTHTHAYTHAYARACTFPSTCTHAYAHTHAHRDHP